MQPLWQHVSRWVLIAVLLYGVYSETGPFTALAIGLVFLTLDRSSLGAPPELSGVRWSSS